MTFQGPVIGMNHDTEVLNYSYDQIRSLVLQASGIAEREDLMPLANLLTSVADAVAALRTCSMRKAS
jgi:hypothetical protein